MFPLYKPFDSQLARRNAFRHPCTVAFLGIYLCTFLPLRVLPVQLYCPLDCAMFDVSHLHPRFFENARNKHPICLSGWSLGRVFEVQSPLRDNSDSQHEVMLDILSLQPWTIQTSHGPRNQTASSLPDIRSKILREHPLEFMRNYQTKSPSMQDLMSITRESLFLVSNTCFHISSRKESTLK